MGKKVLSKGIVASGLVVFLALSLASASDVPNEQFVNRSTADHKKFQALNQEFQTGPEVTKACLTCHTEAASQVHKSIHWTWKWDKAGGVGKTNSVNNF